MTRCHTHEITPRAGADCDDCRKDWENDKSICAKCWLPVSNAAYFGKRGKSVHIDGKCSERQIEIPKSWFERRTTKPRGYDVTGEYWQSSKIAGEMHDAWVSGQEPSRITANICLPAEDRAAIESPSTENNDDKAQALIAALEEQNRLLRQLAA